MEIIIYPSDILRKKSKKIRNFNDSDLKKFAEELSKTMKKADGLGLAAPQLGHNSRIIAINAKGNDKIFINPRITLRSWFRKEIGEEGCLSLPKIYGLIKRHKKIKVVYYDLSGQKKKLRAEGLLARVFQHEIDHLNGILFIDRTKNITQGDNELNKLSNKPSII
jgi:peptide deformylase